MSFTEDFLIILSSYPKGYKLMRARMGGYEGPPEFLFGEKRKVRKTVKDSSFRVILARLQKQGYVERNDLMWRITEKGRIYLENRLVGRLPRYSKRDAANTAKEKNMIIIFDIPEKLRGKRNWLREELTRLGFSMLQKSVWFGPSPLPKTCVQHFKDLNVLPYIKFFRANETTIL
jgi:phenylacetic acid degradation operon negative regulatory protein